jgi:hypothetical protein
MQQRGIGKLLFSTCIKKLIESGYKKLIIRAIKENTKSVL